ncbi:MAG: L-serine ammonia-lyase, iron-sulfur-dependent subunit beta [Defluviitaleaceae bacterium]|nr:L-serine ammonia-lyase, iron-sulfur-dependent subunit beta [Defluviitaleaceae bacterium]MCL2274478.1 L-serine ammonia-lyase, iron-sulfur-dependent subunit beta [Defluviitaleaceae bacterium]
MHIFDIIGPVMIGPSSSHTAGALQLGYLAYLVLKQVPSKAVIKFHGSFAQTFKGHGSDKAVIGGLLGYRTDDVRIRTSLQDAAAQGMQFSFQTVQLPNAHPNTIVIEAQASSGAKTEIIGESVGGGNIRLTSLDGIEIEYTGSLNTLIVEIYDYMGAVSQITGIFMEKGVNIERMRFFKSKNDTRKAITIVETGDAISEAVTQSALGLENAITAIYLPKID